jgi:hypothetical protein
MSALLKEHAFTPHDPDSIESVEAAIEELTRLYVEADARRNRVGRRLREVQSGAVELRRRHARTQLDAFLPPLHLLSIDYAEAVPARAPTFRGVFVVLLAALDDVVRIWWGRHLKPWWNTFRRAGRAG